MNFVEDKLPALVREELEAANRVNPPFNSEHEGYAVLLEEVEETKHELEEVDTCLRILWDLVKHDHPKTREYAGKVATHAMHAAAEAIQVAAMAMKFQNIGRNEK